MAIFGALSAISSLNTINTINGAGLGGGESPPPKDPWWLSWWFVPIAATALVAGIIALGFFLVSLGQYTQKDCLKDGGVVGTVPGSSTWTCTTIKQG
jgi:hypothetical protein